MNGSEALTAVFFLFQFCDVTEVALKWWSFPSIFSHIWQYPKYGSRKSQLPFHIVGNSCNFLWLFLKTFLVLRILFSKSLFCKMAKIHHQKNHGLSVMNKSICAWSKILQVYQTKRSWTWVLGQGLIRGRGILNYITSSRELVLVTVNSLNTSWTWVLGQG